MTDKSLWSIDTRTPSQTVLTPKCIVDRLNILWGEGIKYDPCWAEGSLTNPDRKTSSRGLLDDWADYTYCNPPYGLSFFDPDGDAKLIAAEIVERAAAKAEGRPIVKPPGGWAKKAGLKYWLQKQLDSPVESVMLVPNRTHRRWLRAWRRGVDALVELDPLVFLEHKSTFPAPLVLGYRGTSIDRFKEIFSDLGDPV